MMWLFFSDEVYEISIHEKQLSTSSHSSIADTQALDDVQFVELEKGDKGLGFSILDYQVNILLRKSIIGS